VKPYLISILTLVIASCSSISKPDESTAKIAIEKPAVIEFLYEKMNRIGQLTSEPPSTINSFQLDDPKVRIEVIEKTKGKVVSNIMCQFTFANDSICKNTFEQLKDELDDTYGKSAGSSTFRSWEFPSQRKFVAAFILDNKSSFYGKPVIDVQLIENDDRHYRK